MFEININKYKLIQEERTKKEGAFIIMMEEHCIDII
jgi:hypothetical protein